MVGDIKEVGKIDVQLEDFKSRSKFFGRQVATLALKTKTPAQWWESYGAEHPELQRFAIQVSSLTCSSRGCGHNGSAFEMVRFPVYEMNCISFLKLPSTYYVLIDFIIV